jgi:hypothetical protein
MAAALDTAAARRKHEPMTGATKQSPEERDRERERERERDVRTLITGIHHRGLIVIKSSPQDPDLFKSVDATIDQG